MPIFMVLLDVILTCLQKSFVACNKRLMKSLKILIILQMMVSKYIGES